MRQKSSLQWHFLFVARSHCVDFILMFTAWTLCHESLPTALFGVKTHSDAYIFDWSESILSWATKNLLHNFEIVCENHTHTHSTLTIFGQFKQFDSIQRICFGARDERKRKKMPWVGVIAKPKKKKTDTPSKRNNKFTQIHNFLSPNSLLYLARFFCSFDIRFSFAVRNTPACQPTLADVRSCIQHR